MVTKKKTRKTRKAKKTIPSEPVHYDFEKPEEGVLIESPPAEIVYEGSEPLFEEPTTTVEVKVEEPPVEEEKEYLLYEEYVVESKESEESKKVDLLPTNPRFANLINLYGKEWEIFKNPADDKGNILLANYSKGYKVLAKVTKEDIRVRPGPSKLIHPSQLRAMQAKTKPNEKTGKGEHFIIDRRTGIKWIIDPKTGDATNPETGEVVKNTQ